MARLKRTATYSQKKPFYAGLRFRRPKVGNMAKMRKALRAAGFSRVFGVGLLHAHTPRTAKCGDARKKAAKGIAILKKFGAPIERWDTGLKVQRSSAKGYAKLTKCPIR